MVKVLAEVTGSISFSQKGDKGQKGALMREHDGFESGSYKYLSGTGEEAYVDVVCVEGKWYQCTKTYDDATSSPSLTDGHWTEMSNYKSIATHLLLAENATINMLGSNQINLLNPSGGAMFGSFRVVSKDNDYALWLGAPNGADAPFSVKRSGFTKMTDADITGKVTAKSGFVGDFTIADGSIKYTSTTKTCEFCKDYIQYADAVNNQSLYFGYGDSGVKAEFTAKDNNGKDMTCSMISGVDDVGKNKIVALTTTMTGYTSKLTPRELKLGDYFHNYVQFRVANDISNFGYHGTDIPTTGLKCLVDKKASALYLFLAGIPSGIPSVARQGMIYEENGILKIYKGR